MESRRLTWFLNINLYLIFVATIFTFRIGGFAFQGYLWVFALLYSLYIIAKNKKNRFPVWYILPWAIYLIIHLLLDFTFLGLQSTIMILSPLFVGMAVSGFNYSEIEIDDILSTFRKFATVFIIFSFFYSLVYYKRVGFAANAAVVMSAIILAAFTISEFYTSLRIKDLVKYGLLLLIPVFAVTRMAIFMGVLLLVVTFVRTRFSIRLMLIAASLFIGSLIFYSAPVQEKMFYTGSGSIEDLSMNNDNFRTTGRAYIYDLLRNDLKEEDRVFGKGPRSDVLLFKKMKLRAGETHNDYLSTIYNYGYVGLVLLILYNILFLWKTFRVHRRLESREVQILSATALALFVSFAGFLYSDNVLRYNIYFTNIHFALMGIIFGIIHYQESFNLNNVDKNPSSDL